MMRVFTRAPDGTAAQLHVATEAGTDGLLALVQARHGIPAGMQRLVYGGRRILGGASLASYGLEDGATVEICLELLGGGASWPPETLNFRHTSPAVTYTSTRIRTHVLAHYACLTAICLALRRHSLTGVARSQE